MPIHAHIPLIISVNYFRVFKFIELLLRIYAHNPDGDVKGMFRTAYNRLLRDHPHLKTLKKHSVCLHLNSIPNSLFPSVSIWHLYHLSLYMLTWQHLLRSVPSDKEFKILLGNSKNIKDCGISVAQSLMNLTDRWHKLSVSFTLYIVISINFVHYPVFLKYANILFNI